MSETVNTGEAAAGLWFLNTRVIVRRAAAAGADGVSILEHHLPSGDSPPLHLHHDEDEVFHVLDGRMRFRVGEREFTLCAGDTAVAPKGLPHSYRVESPDGARCLTMVRGSGFESLVRGVSRPAAAAALPEPVAATPEMIAGLTRLAAANGIDLVGPPLA